MTSMQCYLHEDKVMVSFDKAVALERARQWWVEESDKDMHSISALVGPLIRETALCYRETILVSQLLEMLVSNRGRRAREPGSKVERAHHLHRSPHKTPIKSIGLDSHYTK